MRTNKQIIAMSVPVTITAGETEGEKKGPAKFNVLAYAGGILPGALRNGDSHEDVIMDLAGMQTGKSLIANLDHETSQRVGHVNAIGNDLKELNLAGIASAATPARDQVVASAADGFVWQASVEAAPTKIEQVKPGTTIKVNGQEFTAPPARGRALYVARESTLKGFAFVSHGADDNTTVTIAASAASTKEKTMKAEVKAWASDVLLLDVDSLSDEQKTALEADFDGKKGKRTTTIKGSDNPFEARKSEAKRRGDIRDIAGKFIERRSDDLEYIEAIEKMVDHAIEANMSAQEFRSEMYESMIPLANTVPSPRTRDRGLNDRILTAALCESGRLANLNSEFKDEELQAAHDRFPQGISLNELMITAAQANGYRGPVTTQVTKEIHNYAYGMGGGRQIQASGGGFSPINIANIVAATANKFMKEGWMAVDLTPLKLSNIRPVRNFQTITTVSLTGHLQFEKVGPDGELKHGALADLTYTNKADTYGLILAITRTDYINDDQSCLISTPRRMGRGGALKLNDIWWTKFLGLVSANFFASGNSNINTGVADMTVAGLDATETIFMNQTDPDGKPLGIMAKILLVPSALKNKGQALMYPQSKLTSGATAGLSDANVFAGRFQLESSPYISNSSYTGYTSQGYWMLADPAECPVMEIAALNGRVEPIVETADAAFNVLGSQMRGYSDIGVNSQEYRGGVYADGGSS